MLYDGQHCIHAVLSFSAANKLDYDEDDTGINTKNLLGRLIVPSKALIVPHLHSAARRHAARHPMHAVLLLQDEVHCAADLVYNRPASIPPFVEDDPEVMAHLRTCVAKDLARYPTASVLIKHRHVFQRQLRNCTLTESDRLSQIDSIANENANWKAKAVNEEDLHASHCFQMINEEQGFPTPQLLENNEQQAMCDSQVPCMLSPPVRTSPSKAGITTVAAPAPTTPTTPTTHTAPANRRTPANQTPDTPTPATPTTLTPPLVAANPATPVAKTPVIAPVIQTEQTAASTPDETENRNAGDSSGANNNNNDVGNDIDNDTNGTAVSKQNSPICKDNNHGNADEPVHGRERTVQFLTPPMQSFRNANCKDGTHCDEANAPLSCCGGDSGEQETGNNGAVRNRQDENGHAYSSPILLSPLPDEQMEDTYLLDMGQLQSQSLPQTQHFVFDDDEDEDDDDNVDDEDDDDTNNTNNNNNNEFVSNIDSSNNNHNRRDDSTDDVDEDVEKDKGTGKERDADKTADISTDVREGDDPTVNARASPEPNENVEAGIAIVVEEHITTKDVIDVSDDHSIEEIETQKRNRKSPPRKPNGDTKTDGASQKPKSARTANVVKEISGKLKSSEKDNNSARLGSNRSRQAPRNKGMQKRFKKRRKGRSKETSSNQMQDCPVSLQSLMNYMIETCNPRREMARPVTLAFPSFFKKCLENCTRTSTPPPSSALVPHADQHMSNKPDATSPTTAKTTAQHQQQPSQQQNQQIDMEPSNNNENESDLPPTEETPVVPMTPLPAEEVALVVSEEDVPQPAPKRQPPPAASGKSDNVSTKKAKRNAFLDFDENDPLVKAGLDKVKDDFDLLSRAREAVAKDTLSQNFILDPSMYLPSNPVDMPRALQGPDPIIDLDIPSAVVPETPTNEN